MFCDVGSLRDHIADVDKEEGKEDVYIFCTAGSAEAAGHGRHQRGRCTHVLCCTSLRSACSVL